MDDAAFREHLVRILDWEEAHVGFERAIKGVPANKRGVRPKGFEHSIWALLEHLRIAQADILDFCVNASYEHLLAWPDDYWPRKTSKPTEAAWKKSIAAFKRDREAMKDFVRTTPDLAAPVPTGKPNQTCARAVLLLADHNAYHFGQIVAVRRALGIWS
ncbi:MAG: DinB family protein [Vicinamibacterales bacterium]